MQVQIHSIHFDADERLLNFTQTKLGKLSTFHDQIISAEVFFRVEKNDARENKLTEIKLHVPGADLFAKRRASTFEASIDQVIEALRRQIQRQKKQRETVS